MATQPCDVLSDNEKLFRVTTGINPGSFNFYMQAFQELQGGQDKGGDEGGDGHGHQGCSGRGSGGQDGSAVY